MKWLLISILIIMTIIIIIPPIVYDYIYPTSGDDTATHLYYFENMDKYNPHYGGQYLIGKLINALPYNPIDTFTWYHYVVMVLALWTVGLVMAVTVNYLAGILTVFITFGASYLMSLFQWGQIFDIVGIAILLPILMLCFHNMHKKIGWKLGAIVSLLAFATFHANGKYLYALAPMVIVYEIVRVVLPQRYQKFKTGMNDYRILYYTGGLSAVLALLYAIEYKPAGDPGRLWMDGTILVVMFICGLCGYLLSKKNIVWQVAGIVLAVLISLPNIMLWSQDNSALKQVDRQAIAYLNNMSKSSYTASSEVAQWIYGFYLKKEFQDTYCQSSSCVDYVIVRSVPMTPRSAVGNLYFENQGREMIADEVVSNGYKLLMTFDEGEKDRVTKLPITVSVYGR